MKSHQIQHLVIACDRTLRVVADDLLKQVFVNLLKNSLEHCDGDEPRIKISVQRSGGGAVVDYQDSCQELPQNVQEVLFDKFTPSSRGFGLGLFIMRKLMARYGGKIRYVRKDGANHFVLEMNAV
ncbi:ATP-binding protein [Candidatus Thorarchaeota archaeon]|nr:MAG: ATP-binding protein [Candidatus Thorarchaeota archaeon]